MISLRVSLKPEISTRVELAGTLWCVRLHTHALRPEVPKQLVVVKRWESLVGTAAGITQLLERWSEGDRSALDELMPLVYDELHRLAGRHLAREARNNSLQSTAIVNEAYMRLSAQKKLSWENRVQFFGLASKLMRNILVDHARA